MAPPQSTGLEHRCTETVTDYQKKACDEGPDALAPALRTDADLRAAVEVWPKLPKAIRRAIVSLIESTR